MSDISIKDDLMTRIDKLHPELQRRLLDFVKTLAPGSFEGNRLLRFEGAIPIDDLELMSKAIEEGCEKKGVKYEK